MNGLEAAEINTQLEKIILNHLFVCLFVCLPLLQEVAGIKKLLEKEELSVLGALDQYNAVASKQEGALEDSDKGRDAVLAHQLKNVLIASLAN